MHSCRLFSLRILWAIRILAATRGLVVSLRLCLLRHWKVNLLAFLLVKGLLLLFLLLFAFISALLCVCLLLDRVLLDIYGRASLHLPCPPLRKRKTFSLFLPLRLRHHRADLLLFRLLDLLHGLLWLPVDFVVHNTREFANERVEPDHIGVREDLVVVLAPPGGRAYLLHLLQVAQLQPHIGKALASCLPLAVLRQGDGDEEAFLLEDLMGVDRSPESGDLGVFPVERLVEELVLVGYRFLEADGFGHKPVAAEVKLEELGTGGALSLHELLTLPVERELHVLEGDLATALCDHVRVYEPDRVHEVAWPRLELE